MNMFCLWLTGLAYFIKTSIIHHQKSLDSISAFVDMFNDLYDVSDKIQKQIRIGMDQNSNNKNSLEKIRCKLQNDELKKDNVLLARELKDKTDLLDEYERTAGVRNPWI